MKAKPHWMGGRKVAVLRDAGIAFWEVRWLRDWANRVSAEIARVKKKQVAGSRRPRRARAGIFPEYPGFGLRFPGGDEDLAAGWRPYWRQVGVRCQREVAHWQVRACRFGAAALKPQMHIVKYLEL